MRRNVLLSLVLSAPLASCTEAPKAPPHPLEGLWRTSPEDLPYTGGIPNQPHVTDSLMLGRDGFASFRPLYTGGGFSHVGSSADDGKRFRWREADGLLTFEDDTSTCRGSASETKIEIDVAGCTILAQLVSLPKVSFARP